MTTPRQEASYLYSTTQADPNATYATIPLLDHPHHGSQRVGLPVTGNPTLLQGLDGSGIAYQEPRAFPYADFLPVDQTWAHPGLETTEIPFRASAYDPIDALNPGGLGKIVDVSRIFVPEPSVATATGQVDSRVHPSYVDGVVASLGTKVKTGTGMARKTPVQLNDGSWAPGYSSAAVGSMGATERSNMISTYGRRHPSYLSGFSHRMLGEPSSHDRQLESLIGKNYSTFQEAHSATYFQPESFVSEHSIVKPSAELDKAVEMHRNSEIHPESSGLAYTERLLSVHEKRTIGEAKESYHVVGETVRYREFVQEHVLAPTVTLEQQRREEPDPHELLVNDQRESYHVVGETVRYREFPQEHVPAPTVALEQQVREQYRQEQDLQELLVNGRRETFHVVGETVRYREFPQEHVLAPTVALEQQVREQYRQEEDLQELVVSPEIIDKFRRLELEEQNFQQQSQTHQKQVFSHVAQPVFVRMPMVQYIENQVQQPFSKTIYDDTGVAPDAMVRRIPMVLENQTQVQRIPPELTAEQLNRLKNIIHSGLEKTHKSEHDSMLRDKLRQSYNGAAPIPVFSSNPGFVPTGVVPGQAVHVHQQLPHRHLTLQH